MIELHEHSDLARLKAWWSRRESKLNGDNFAGIEYDAQLAGSGGVLIVLFPHEGHTGEELLAAQAEARIRRDVVDFDEYRVPRAWYEEERHVPEPGRGPKGWIQAVEWICEHKQCRRVIPETGELVPEKKRGGILLDLFSANAMLAVYKALNPEKQAHFVSLDLRKAHALAFRLVK